MQGPLSLTFSSRKLVIGFCPLSTFLELFPFSLVVLQTLLGVVERVGVVFGVVLLVVCFLLNVVDFCCFSCCSLASLSNRFLLRPIPSSFPSTSVLVVIGIWLLGVGAGCGFVVVKLGFVVVKLGLGWILGLVVGFGCNLGSIGGLVGAWGSMVVV